jgi:hypothetical protein
MLMLRRTHRRLAEELQRLLDRRRTERDEARAHSLRLTIRVELLEQARDKAEADARYWRTRAEKFIDQVALQSGTLSAPVMDPAPASQADDVRTVFSALGVSEINITTAEAARAAPAVRQVDSRAAAAAVADLLDTV